MGTGHVRVYLGRGGLWGRARLGNDRPLGPLFHDVQFICMTLRMFSSYFDGELNWFNMNDVDDDPICIFQF